MEKYCLLLIAFGSIACSANAFQTSQLTNSLANRTLRVTTLLGTCVKENEGQLQGYCVDLLEKLSHTLGFRYNLNVSKDGKYGMKDNITGQWNGAVGEVIRGESDLVLADLTMTFSREKVIDFTTPFLHTSVAALYKRSEFTFSGLFAVFNPFSSCVWLTIALAFIASLGALKLVAYVSPYHAGDSEEVKIIDKPSLGQDLSVVNSLYLLASSFVLRATDIRLESTATRAVAVVWSLFALLTIIIYACSVSHSFERQLPEENTLAGLLKVPNINFGTVQGGSTYRLLKSSGRPHIQQVGNSIERNSPKLLTRTVDEGILKVRESNGEYAFIGEGRALQAAANQDCSLTVTNGFDSRSFGIAVQKGSPLREEFSQAILVLQETGVFSELEQKYWPQNVCEVHHNQQIQFSNFVGPLVILCVGLAAAVVLAFIEKALNKRGK